MTNWTWTKYDYLCTDCDAPIEITTLKDVSEYFQPLCPCGSFNIINIGTSNGNAPLFEPVTNITPAELDPVSPNRYN